MLKVGMFYTDNEAPLNGKRVLVLQELIHYQEIKKNRGVKNELQRVIALA